MNPLANRLLEGDIPDPDAPSASSSPTIRGSVITGYSEKQDGIIFVSSHPDSDSALADLVANFPACCLIGGNLIYKTHADEWLEYAGQDADGQMDLETPGREGWALYIDEIENGWADGAVCW
jgi:hypothetical protein